MSSVFKTKEIKGTRTVGEKLRLARKRRQITLDDAERDTKIRLKYLEAFERGRYRDLPSEVYALGFLRRYIEYLGLKTEAILELFKAELQAAASTKINKEDKGQDFSPVTTMPKWQFSITPVTIAIAAIIFLVIGLFGYIWYAVDKFSANPKLTINQPKSEAIITADELAIRGQTDIGAFVYINREPVNVSPTGSFNQTVNLSEGMNTIEIVAKNRLDRHTAKTIKVVTDNPATN